MANFRVRYGDWADAAERAIRHARLAGRPNTNLFGLGYALHSGPRAADAALEALDAHLPREPPSGAAPAARDAARDARTFRRRLGNRTRGKRTAACADVLLAEIATLEGDHVAAAGFLRRQCDLFEAQGYRSALSGYAPALGRSLCALGRHEEAESLAQLGRELAGEKDVWAQAIWRQVQARVHAHRGEHEQAEPLAREAGAIIGRTDALNYQGEALCDLAEVLRASGRNDEAAATLAEALERYERKKNLAMAAQVRDRLAAWQTDALPA